MSGNNAYSLLDRHGQRKYLNSKERVRFYELANAEFNDKKLFLLTLFHSGARISEVLNLHPNHIDTHENIIVVECLKKRRKGIFRIIPLPQTLIYQLQLLGENKVSGESLWGYPRRTATRYVKRIMIEANIIGSQASAKGLRHSFAVNAIEKNVPLNLIKNWMGHSSISTTEIYLDVIGQEERHFAQRMWQFCL